MDHSMPNGSKFPAYPILNLLKLLKMLYIMIDQRTKNFNFICSVLFKIWKVQTCHILAWTGRACTCFIKYTSVLFL